VTTEAQRAVARDEAATRLSKIRYRIISLNAGDVTPEMRAEERAAYAAWKEAQKPRIRES
jgi:hypothetical protein